MTYCLGLVLEQGLVLASDSRTNAGVDYVTTFSKLHSFTPAPERIFVLLSAARKRRAAPCQSHRARPGSDRGPDHTLHGTARTAAMTEPGKRGRMIRRWAGAALTIAALGTTPWCASAADPMIEQRLQTLEGQVRGLIRRIEQIEQAASAPAAQGTTVADGIAWTFDEYVGTSPFEVSYKSFDRKTGAVELLLQITAPLDRPDLWTEAGASVPILLRHRAADGTEGTTPFSLVRLSRLDPGARLHVRARLEPARAAAASHLSIRHAAD